MIEKTRNLALPLITDSQAQKHITHNEALAMLDALVHASVIAKDVESPPSLRRVGDAYLIAKRQIGGTEHRINNWDYKSNQLAVCVSPAGRYGKWNFFTPREGWIVWVINEKRHYIYTDDNWYVLDERTSSSGASTEWLKTNSALITATNTDEGGTGDLTLVLRKEDDDKKTSLLFKTGDTPRMEIATAKEAYGDPGYRQHLSEGFRFNIFPPDYNQWHTIINMACLKRFLIEFGTGLVPMVDGRYSVGTVGRAWGGVVARRLHSTEGFSTYSDERLKESIDYNNVPGLDFVNRLRPVTYKNIDQACSHDDAKVDIELEDQDIEQDIDRDCDLIAQDASEVLDEGGKKGRGPHCGFISQDIQDLLQESPLALLYVDEDSKDQLACLIYDEFVPILTKAIQELTARVVQLEAAQESRQV